MQFYTTSDYILTILEDLILMRMRVLSNEVTPCVSVRRLPMPLVHYTFSIPLLYGNPCPTLIASTTKLGHNSKEILNKYGQSTTYHFAGEFRSYFLLFQVQNFHDGFS